MPDGQYSFYLHSDDRTDIAAMATISTISQPLRGEFIRTAATAGAVVYRGCPFTGADPGVLCRAAKRCPPLRRDGLVSGTWSSLTGLPDEPENGGAALPVSPETEYQRRRYTLTLQNGRSGERVESVLTEASSRLRGDLLRNLIITGLALHTTAPELPRLLASMPVPPTSVSELQSLVQQMAGTADVNRAAAAVPDTPAASAAPVSGSDTREIKKNMRRAFGD